MDEKEKEELLKKIEEYSKKIEKNPNDASNYYNRGNAYYNRGDTFKSLEKFQEAVDDFKKAIEDYNKAIELNPNNASYYNNRGNAYGNLKKYEKAIEDYNKAIELNPNYSLAYNNRGNTFSILKEYEKAIEDFKKAIELNPNNAYYYNRKGNAFFYEKKYDKAIDDYSEAIKLKPKEASYYNNRGNAFFYEKKYDKAIDDYSEAIRLKPKEASYYNNRGISFYNKKDYDKAIDDYSEAIRLKPKEASYYNNRGVSFYNKKDYDKAIEDYNKAIKINSNYNLALKNKDIILKKIKKNQEIENNLGKQEEIIQKRLTEKNQIDIETVRITNADSNYSLMFNKINSLYMTGNYKEIEKELLPRIQDFKKESKKQVKTPEIENLIRKVDLIKRIFNEKPKKLEGYLIFADILGWKGIWKKQDKKDIANVTFFIKNILEKEFDKEFDKELKEKKYSISLISDTFIVFSEEWELSNKISKKLMELCLENELPIRGAISYGECYNRDTVYVGQAVDEAASWHDEGEEIGIFCTPSAKQEIINNDYDLPEDFIKLKSGEINTFFINWYNKETKKKFDELFSKIDKSSIKVYLKYLNTEKKFDKYLKEEKK